MKFRFLLYLIAGFAIFGINPALNAYAASVNDIIVSIVPSNPAPHENTNITLKSYAYNLDSVLISWLVNGKTVISGIGKKSFSTAAPAAGGETKVIARISLPDGTIDTAITIKPSVMVLLWQANDSYVPPFYKGKALPTADSEIKVVAMPEIRNGSGYFSSQNMTYRWKKDYTNNVDGSGYGKNYFLYISDYLDNSNNISVTASTLDETFSTGSNVDIRTAQPKILFYRNDNGTILGQAIQDTHKIQESETIEGVPYFISPKEIQNPALAWNWFINDSRVNIVGFKKNLMPLQVESGVHGTSKLKLEIENKDKIFQTTVKEISIEF